PCRMALDNEIAARLGINGGEPGCQPFFLDDAYDNVACQAKMGGASAAACRTDNKRYVVRSSRFQQKAQVSFDGLGRDIWFSRPQIVGPRVHRTRVRADKVYADIKRPIESGFSKAVAYAGSGGKHA